MCEDSDSDDFDVSSPYLDDDSPIYHSTQNFTLTLSPNEEVTSEKLEKITRRFSEVFAQRYPESNLNFCVGSLDEALNRSIENLEDPRPLMLYVRHKKTLADNDFCKKFFLNKKIVDLLNDEFVIWPWDRTDIDYYRLLVKLLIDKFGNEVTSNIASRSLEEVRYPLLICLAKEHNRYTILDMIDNTVSDEEMMYSILCAARDDFDRSNTQDSGLELILTEEWHMPKSQLTSIDRQSEEFEGIASRLNIEKTNIFQMEKIENIMWSVQYSSEKSKMNDRHGVFQNERELLYGCPSSMAREILQNGFDMNSNCIHGKKHGEGFYFFTERNLCENYRVSDENKSEKKAIIICRILIDRSYTIDHPNIVVLNRNECILPEYLVVYHASMSTS